MYGKMIASFASPGGDKNNQKVPESIILAVSFDYDEKQCQYLETNFAQSKCVLAKMWFVFCEVADHIISHRWARCTLGNVPYMYCTCNTCVWCFICILHI